MQSPLDPRDAAEIARISALLLSPFAHRNVNEWRRAVNRVTRDLVRADSAGFLLPTEDGPLLFSEEHDPEQLARYAHLTPPPLSDGTPIFVRGAELQVGTLAEAYGDDYQRYLDSEYYREYAAPNGARETLYAITVVLGEESHPTTAATLQYWHGRPEAAPFGEREVALLRLLYPSFHSGVHAYVRWWRHRSSLPHTLDALGQAVSIWNADGRLLHQTPKMVEVLAGAGHCPEVLAECERIARAVASRCGEHRATALATTVAPACTAAVAVGSVPYVASGVLYEDPAGTFAAPLVLVSLSCEAPRQMTEEQLRESWALTRMEARVALLLARGMTNRDIAQAFDISEATARRHTERVMSKLDVRSRAQVGPRIAG